MRKDRAQALALTAIAIFAFAGNSLLTRMALAPPEISASCFVGIRLISGALMLASECQTTKRHLAAS